MNDPYRLSLQVELPDGQFVRWGPDERDAIDVPQDLEFGTGIPGGFSDLGCSLLRRIDLDYPDLVEYATVRVLGPGRETVWEGRFARFPRQHGQTFTVQPGAEGEVAHLRDDETFHEVYADRDLPRWREPSVQRRLDHNTASRTVQGHETGHDETNGAALLLPIRGAWASPTTPIIEPTYDAGPGLTVGAIYYDFTGPSSGASWDLVIGTVSTDAWAATDLSADLISGLTGSGYITPTADYRYAVLQLRNTATPGGADAAESLWAIRGLTVYGNHGLTRRGDDPGGFYASDLVADIVRRTAPRLTYSTGDGGSIQTNTTLIEHLVFAEPTTGEQALRQVTDFTLSEWGVYENREFFWRTPDEDRCCWQARLDQAARPSLDGPSGVDRPNGVMVSYSDFAGVAHLVGPPGSDAETTSSDLEDSDPQNPATLAGVRKWPVLSVGEMSEDRAIDLGRVWLTERITLAQRRGEVELTGMVDHPTAGKRPVWAIRAGDHIQFTDANNNVKRRIIETRYSHETRTIRLTLDNSAFRADAIIGRLAAALTGAV